MTTRDDRTPPDAEPIERGRVIGGALLLGLAALVVILAIRGGSNGEAVPSAGVQRPGEALGSVRVEVLNGAGTAGLARDATRRLRSDGFDVVFFGNAGRFDHAASVAIDRVGDLRRARAVAASLGIDSVTSAPDPSLMLEVTVVLGGDWPPQEPVDPSWMDWVRGVIGDRPDSSAGS